VAEGMKSLFSTDVGISGGLENERFDGVGWRSAGLYSSRSGPRLSSTSSKPAAKPLSAIHHL